MSASKRPNPPSDPRVPEQVVPEAASTAWRGTLAGTGGESGVFDLIVDGKQNARAHVRRVGGEEVSLTGALEAKSGSLTLAASGYDFRGAIADGVLTGTFFAGKSSGSFSALRAEGTAPAVYCGTFDGAVKGTWNLVIAQDGTVTGSHAGGATGPVRGQVDTEAATRTITLTHQTGTATGVLSGAVVEGTFNIGASRGGTWSGSIEGCE